MKPTGSARPRGPGRRNPPAHIKIGATCGPIGAILRLDIYNRSIKTAILSLMPNYRRALVPGGCFFFTVNLLERQQTLLVDHIAGLRASVAATRQGHPFVIDAFVVLPDHLHAVWTLPPGDSDFATRCG